jgi:hypothetical protein
MSPIIEALNKAEELIRHHVGETPETLETIAAIARARDLVKHDTARPTSSHRDLGYRG